MSQRETLRALDADLVASLKDAGLADDGAYTSKAGGDAIACDVIVQRGVQVFAEGGADIAARDIVVTLFLAQVAPERGGTVVADGDTFTLVDVIDSDESRERWTVRHE